MTLIAAFRCNEGVVICADTQETVGSVRVAVNKLTPHDAGEYQLAIAGSGNGDLIEAFADSLGREVTSWPAGLSEPTARGLVRGLLLDFHGNEIAHYPADTPGEKLNHFLVCIKPKASQDVFLWELRGSAIVTVGDYTLLGIGEAIYKHELKRLYRTGMQGLQAVLLGIHLFSLAKETSNYVGGPTDVIFVSANRMEAERPKDVRRLEEYVGAINERIAALILACSDTSRWDSQLAEELDRFRDEILRLRNNFAKTEQTMSFIRTLNDPTYAGDPYAKFPPGSIVHITEGHSFEGTTPSTEPENPPLDSQTSEGQT